MRQKKNANTTTQTQPPYYRLGLIFLVGIFVAAQFQSYLFGSSLNGNGSAKIKTNPTSNYNSSTLELNLVVGSGPIILNKSQQHAVVHVGPHKTGSTSLQHLIYQVHRNRESDRYFIPFIPGPQGNNKNMANIAFSLQDEETNQRDKRSFPAFKAFLSNNNASCVLSSEEFAQPSVNISRLKNALEPKYKVTIIVVYRRYFEWMASLYSELHKKPLKNEVYLQSLQAFEANCPSFVQWIRPILTSLIRTGKGDSHLDSTTLLPSTVAARYQEYFNDVRILNMHEDEPFAVRFFCNMLYTKSDTVCQKVKRSNNVFKALNTRATDLGDGVRLRSAAKAKGIIRKLDMIGVKQVQSFIAQNKGLPRNCLRTEEVDFLWQFSLKQEKKMTPTWFARSGGGEPNLKAAFEKFQEKGVLCSLNVTAVLTDSLFLEFLDDVNATNRA